MGVVVVLLVVVGLLLVQLRQPPPEVAAPERPLPDPDAAQDGLTVETGLFTEEFLRDRMRMLAAELERLDRDPDVFAKAFHTYAARTAYEALLVDASVVTDRPRWRVGEVLDADELPSEDDGRREIIEF